MLPVIDMVLLMSVNPGFGGQKFMPESLDRARALRQRADVVNPKLDIEMDGGIGLSNLEAVRDSGVNAFVVGSAIFKASDVTEATKEFKSKLSGA